MHGNAEARAPHPPARCLPWLWAWETRGVRQGGRAREVGALSTRDPALGVVCGHSLQGSDCWTDLPVQTPMQ